MIVLKYILGIRKLSFSLCKLQYIILTSDMCPILSSIPYRWRFRRRWRWREWCRVRPPGCPPARPPSVPSPHSRRPYSRSEPRPSEREPGSSGRGCGGEQKQNTTLQYNTESHTVQLLFKFTFSNVEQLIELEHLKNYNNLRKNASTLSLYRSHWLVLAE